MPNDVLTRAIDAVASGNHLTADHSSTVLAEIMEGIHHECLVTADRYGSPGNYVMGANLAGYTKVADAMVALGVI